MDKIDTLNYDQLNKLAKVQRELLKQKDTNWIDDYRGFVLVGLSFCAGIFFGYLVLS